MSRSRHRYFESGFLAPREVRPSRPSIFKRTFAPRVMELWPGGPVVTIHFDAERPWRSDLSKRNPVGLCRTCGKSFRRSRQRQAKCVECWAFNRYRCAQCRETFQREDGIKLCPACLTNAAPPASESAEDWNRFLVLNGHSVSRGEFVGTGRIVYADIAPLAVHDGPLETITDSADIEAAFDNERLLTWFLSAPSREVALKLGIGHEAVQRLRASYLDCDRAEVETARKVLGYSEAEWQRRKLGIGLIESRAAIERQKFAA